MSRDYGPLVKELECMTKEALDCLLCISTDELKGLLTAEEARRSRWKCRYWPTEKALVLHDGGASC